MCGFFGWSTWSSAQDTRVVTLATPWLVLQYEHLWSITRTSRDAPSTDHTFSFAPCACGCSVPGMRQTMHSLSSAARGLVEGTYARSRFSAI